MTFEYAQKIQVGDKVIAGDTGLHAIVLERGKGSKWTGKQIIPVMEFEILYECLGEVEYVTNLELEGVEV